MPAFDMDQDMDGIGDGGFDRFVRKLDAALQDATGQPGECFPAGIGVNGGEAAAVSGIQSLQEVEGFLAANLAQNGAVGAMAETCLEQVTDGDGGDFWSLRAARLEANEVGFSYVNLRRILDDQQAVFLGNEVGQDVQQGGFSCAGAAADQDVSAIQDGLAKKDGHLFAESAGTN